MVRKAEIDLSGDHHVHTRLCNHASGEMEDYVVAAINRGLQSITFLEHLECGILSSYRTWLTEEDFNEYFRQGRMLQILYGDQITIRLGVEVGYNPSAVDQLTTMLSRFPFDHVGLSYHYFFDGNRHLNMLSRRRKNIEALAAAGIDKVLDEYFTGLCRACNDIQCDKVCHLDAALRHMPGFSLKENNWKQIEQLLGLMLKKKIGLEVNTSGFELRSLPFPSPKIIQRAAQLNIQTIAGSDAHRPDQVGRHFDQLAVLFK